MLRRVIPLFLAATTLAVAQAPSNNSCTAPLTVFAGINPQPPSGASGQFFTNVGATDSSSASFSNECGADFNKDVWFTFTAPVTGTYTIRTCTPSGFTSGTLTQTVLAVYDGASCPSGSAIACNDDNTACTIFGSDRSALNVNLFDGRDYLIRVGTESATQTGTFYLDIEAPTTAANDTCLGAIALAEGANSGSFNGSNGSTTTYGCSEFSVSNSDVWFTYTGTILNLLSPKEVAIRVTGAADFFAIYSGTCSLFPASSFSTIACGNVGEWHSFVPGNDVYYIRVGRNEESEPSLGFTVEVSVEPLADNDTCANGVTTFGGVQPSNSDVAGFYTNVGATDTSFGFTTTCVGTTNSDVWYDYIATTTGKVAVSTLTPAGQVAGTLTDTVVAVFSSCGTSSAIACNDDFGAGFLSYLEFDAIHGVHYKIMVASYGSTANNEGTFWLSIVPRFRLSMSSPSGAGSLRMDLNDGGSAHGFYTCITVNQGTFPYGPFYGVQPTFTELVLQLTSGTEPFLGAMNAAGAYTFGPLAGLPNGIALYAVTLEFDALGAVVGVTPPTSHVIP